MSSDRFRQIRLAEALLFVSAEPLGADQIRRHLPEDTDLDGLMEELAGLYANRGVNLVRVGQRWAFRTAADLTPMMQIETTVARKLSRAGTETLAIVAYHQPVTRAEIEEIRGVALSRGTLDTLLEAGWVKPRGRRRTPGRPVTWGTTDGFLDHFGLENLDSLPGIAELKAAGLIDTRPAITALGGRGRLLDPGESGVDTDDLAAADDAVDDDAVDDDTVDDGVGDDDVGDDDVGDEGGVASELPLSASFEDELLAAALAEDGETGGAAGRLADEEPDDDHEAGTSGDRGTGSDLDVRSSPEH